MTRLIGIDFDNTLISYDNVFFHHALDLKLVSVGAIKSKKALRDQIWKIPDGDLIWQKLQAFVYGEGITQAHLNDGAGSFLRACAQRGVQVCVVSHKTEHSNTGTSRVNLRQAALDWMDSNHFFGGAGSLGLCKEQVYFESTRIEKIERVRSLGCTHFIDDLREVFQEKTFPGGVEKILFATDSDSDIPGDIRVFNHWKQIHEYFFDQ